MSWTPGWWRRRAGKLDRPIVILGSRRSGTTILGRTIGLHAQAYYLHEPRQIWRQAFPQSDIHTDAGTGRIVLDETDWTRDGADRLCRAFSRALRDHKKTRLCEKTPINCFRGPLLNRIMPDALYVCIEREPLAVAESVAARGCYSANDNANNSKWAGISALAEEIAQTRGLARQCETVLQKVLLEWIVCTVFARRFLFNGPVPQDRIMRFRYEDFAQDPAGYLGTLEGFAGLEHDPRAAIRASKLVRPARRAQSHDDDPVIRRLLESAASHPQSKPV